MELKYNTHLSGPEGGKGEQRAEKTMVKNILKVIENTSGHRDKKSVKSQARYKKYTWAHYNKTVESKDK